MALLLVVGVLSAGAWPIASDAEGAQPGRAFQPAKTRLERAAVGISLDALLDAGAADDFDDGDVDDFDDGPVGDVDDGDVDDVDDVDDGDVDDVDDGPVGDNDDGDGDN